MLGVFAPALTIATGLFRTDNAFRNFNMTFFWIAFLLGGCYLSAGRHRLCGDEPVARDAERGAAQRRHGVWRYPAWAAHYPALSVSIAFIWLELFGHATPRSLALMLLGHPLTLAASFACGREHGFAAASSSRCSSASSRG